MCRKEVVAVQRLHEALQKAHSFGIASAVGSIIKGAGDTCWTGAMADNLSVTLVNNPENNATVDIIRCMSSRISDNVEDVDDWAANT